MSERDDFWSRVDSEMVEYENELEREKEWLEHDTDPEALQALEEFQQYLDAMSVEEATTAINGLKEYKDSLSQQNIDLGWHKDLQDGAD